LLIGNLFRLSEIASAKKKCSADQARATAKHKTTPVELRISPRSVSLGVLGFLQTFINTSR
jgi:hypothetical protein